jgi:hypothetical protein
MCIYVVHSIILFVEYQHIICSYPCNKELHEEFTADKWIFIRSFFWSPCAYLLSLLYAKHEWYAKSLSGNKHVQTEK